METSENGTLILPAVALRGLVIFPNMLLHFDVGRKKSIAALNAAMAEQQEILLIAQKDIRTDDPAQDDLYKMGVIGAIRQVVKLPNSENVRVMVEGKCRAYLTGLVQDTPYLNAAVRPRRALTVRSANALYAEALVRRVKDIFDEYAEVAPKLSPDVVLTVMQTEEPGELADYIAANIMLEYPDKQRLLDQLNPLKRLELLCVYLSRETDLLNLECDIQIRVQQQIDTNQREYYLREQLRVISEELGEADNPQEEADAYRERLLKLDLPDQTREKLEKDCARLFKMQPGSQEATVQRNYLDTVLELPWNTYTRDNLDLKNAGKVLDRDHYGLRQVKERMLEMLAVRGLSPDIKGQIICLIGPPGVGKTSVARSVAKAMGRKYARVSLGGVHDEAEIRGHRKTYIGAMPGRIITALKQAGSANALLLLDEVDKLGSDFKGDPSSALLEALDGEQNFEFRDHYIEVPFDLSKVLFLTTANDASAIPQPLLDRMEVIELPSYTHEEKFHIAKEHLVTRQARQHGLNGRSLKITDDALRLLIDGYTREAGVRKLERQIAAVCRKAAMRVASGETKRLTVTVKNLEELLGPQKFRPDTLSDADEIGVATGLAWTSVGGEIMPIEVAVLDGKGELKLTGSLGDVMKESAQAAVSYIRGHAAALGVAPDFYKTKDIHLHVPEGAVPKDGPSAGVTIATALVSALTGRPVRRDLAMTGEITLRGRVLAIGGLKEKSMAAYRAGVHTVLIPADNVSDLPELAEEVKQAVTFLPMREIGAVLSQALLPLSKDPRMQQPAPVVQEHGNRVGLTQ